MRIVRGDVMNITKWFRCNDCWKFHEDVFDAKNCCEPTVFYKCGECWCHHQYEDDAVKCCNPNENEKLKEQLKLG